MQKLVQSPLMMKFITCATLLIHRHGVLLGTAFSSSGAENALITLIVLRS